jgi:hypothetical protein
MNYTDLEQEQIDIMYKIIKRNNKKIHIKNINNITNNIVSEMYTNEQSPSIYNKHMIAKGTLNKLFNNENHIEQNKINNMDNKIYKLINKYEYNKIIKNDRCSKCIIS